MGGVVDAVFGGGDAPEAPDPGVVATKQGKANIEAARVTTALNRANQYNPFGSLVWSQGGDDYDKAGYEAALAEWEGLGDKGGTKAPTKESFGYNPDAWTSTTEYDPGIQAILDANLANAKDVWGAPLSLPQSVNILDLFNNNADRYTDLTDPLQQASSVASTGRQDILNQLGRLRGLYSTELNYDNAPAMPEANEATRQRVEDAIYQRASSRLDPRFTQSEDQLRSRLAAQGITEGSEAYNREMQNFEMARNDAYSSAQNDAIMQSDDALSKIFGMGLQARQQGVGEANTLRAMPTQEVSTLSSILRDLDASSRNWYGTEMNQETAKDNSSASQFNIHRTQEQDALNNQAMVRNQILNELNSIRTGNQSFLPTSSGATVNPAPYAQSAYNSYQGDVNSYNAQQASNANMVNGLIKIGSMFL